MKRWSRYILIKLWQKFKNKALGKSARTKGGEEETTPTQNLSHYSSERDSWVILKYYNFRAAPSPAACFETTFS